MSAEIEETGYSIKSFVFILILIFLCIVGYAKKDPIQKGVMGVLVEFGFLQEVEEPVGIEVSIPEIPLVDEHEIKHFYVRANDAVEIRISYVISPLDYYEEGRVKSLMRGYFSEVDSKSIYHNQHRHMEVMRNLILNEYLGMNIEIIEIRFDAHFISYIQMEQKALMEVEITKARVEESKQRKILMELEAQQELNALEHKRKIDVYNAETAAMIEKIKGK